jgi:hypothetical protein
LPTFAKKAAAGSCVQPPSAANLAFLNKHHVPPRIIETLRACSVSNFVRVGRLTLYPFSELPKQNDKPNQGVALSRRGRDEHRRCAAANGDLKTFPGDPLTNLGVLTG